MQATTTEDALALLRSEADRRYGAEAVSRLEEPLRQLAQDMQTISTVAIPDWMLGELG